MSEEKAGTKFSIVDLRAFEKPAIKLIETIRDAAGVVYEPHRIVRRTKAEAEASIIKAEAEVVKEGVAERARRRNALLENRRQETLRALQNLP